MDRVSEGAPPGRGRAEDLRCEREPFLTVSPLFPLPVVCFLLAGQAASLLPALTAALLHEGAHIAAILLAGGRVTRVSLEPFGGEIVTNGSYRSPVCSFIVSGAGVFMNLLTSALLLIPELPPFIYGLALSSLFLGLFNLLPLRGLDGGDLLSLFLFRVCPPRRAERICRGVALSGAVLFAAFCAAGAVFARFNPMLILLSVYLLLSAL